MRLLFIINFVVLLVLAGCTGQNTPILPREKPSCKGVRDFWESQSYWSGLPHTIFVGKEMYETPAQSPEDLTVAYYGKDSNEPLQKSRFMDLQARALYAAGCCSCKTHPLAKNWTEYTQLECMWEYLEKETVQKIAFCGPDDFASPENWDCQNITEPERIEEVLKLLEKGIKSESDMFVHDDTLCSYGGWMQIVTDKHKFATPFWYDCMVKGAFCGVGWTSYELADRLRQWNIKRW